MNTYPNELKIGAHTYKLVLERYWDGSDDELAHTDYNKAVIRVSNDLPSTQIFATLLHEAIHAMNHTVDHDFHDSLAEQIAQFLIDNNLVREDLI